MYVWVSCQIYAQSYDYSVLLKLFRLMYVLGTSFLAQIKQNVSIFVLATVLWFICLVVLFTN